MVVMAVAMVSSVRQKSYSCSAEEPYFCAFNTKLAGFLLAASNQVIPPFLERAKSRG